MFAGVAKFPLYVRSSPITALLSTYHFQLPHFAYEFNLYSLVNVPNSLNVRVFPGDDVSASPEDTPIRLVDGTVGEPSNQKLIPASSDEGQLGCKFSKMKKYFAHSLGLDNFT